MFITQSVFARYEAISHSLSFWGTKNQTRYSTKIGELLHGVSSVILRSSEWQDCGKIKQKNLQVSLKVLEDRPDSNVNLYLIFSKN